MQASFAEVSADSFARYASQLIKLEDGDVHDQPGIDRMEPHSDVEQCLPTVGLCSLASTT